MSKHHPPKLSDTDLTKRLAKAAYFEQLGELQAKLARIQQAFLFHELKGVLVFEGWDAAGKGGTIRRMSAVLDPRNFKVWPIGAPRQFHLERHYLTRFWERLPPRGGISVFDRSWYGRVLVERVENLTAKRHWRRAYDEINEFERLLVEDGTRVIKFFLHITPEVQLERFEERLRDPMKRWKLSYEDFRNRDKWDIYVPAIEEMFERTSTVRAPWYIIPANDKKHQRIEVLTTIADRLSDGVSLDPIELDAKVLHAASEHFEDFADIVSTTIARSE
ncbi:MAG: polyphosphate kinase [Pseudomonadota bacterium]